MQPFIFIERIFLISFIFLKYSVKKTYIDQFGVRQRLDNPIRLRLVFEDVGGIFMKFGQILAMRFDLLPINYAVALLNLLDNARTIPNNKMFGVFLDDTRKNIKDVFDNFNETSISTASFAQVYKGTYNGKDIIIKIQKPNVKRYITSDMVLLRIFAYIIDGVGILKTVSMSDVLFQFKEWLHDELDYTIEARNAQTIYDNVKKNRLENIVIPIIYHEFTTKRIIVQEFLYGFQVNKIINELMVNPEHIKNTLKENGIDLLRVSNLFISDLMRQYFIDGVFHADPHPANLMIFSKNKIGYIDFGIIGKSKYNNFDLLRYINGVAELEFKIAADGMVNFIGTYIKNEMGSVLDDKKIKTFYDIVLRFITDKLTEDFKPIVNDWHFHTGNKDLELKERSAAVAFLKMVKAVEKYHLKFPSDVIAFIRALLIIDMVCLKMADNFNMIKAIQSFFNLHSLEKVKTSIHNKEAYRIYGTRQIKENLEYNREQEYNMKEKFTDIVYILAEKYPELYNKIKRI